MGLLVQYRTVAIVSYLLATQQRPLIPITNYSLRLGDPAHGLQQASYSRIGY